MAANVILDAGFLIALLNQRDARKHPQVPMSFADACIVRMTEIAADPFVLTTDSDFRVYLRFQCPSAPQPANHSLRNAGEYVTVPEF